MKKMDKTLLASTLVVVSMLSLATLIVGLLTRRIDGIAQGGNDYIHFATHPIGFCILAVAYLALAIMSALGAYALLKR